ncbi:hypothetical protein ABZP36_029804 [Zizania latifolia]
MALVISLRPAGDEGAASSGASGGGVGRRRAGGANFVCRTCSRRFPSFQALGGHRTGHTRHALALQRRRRLQEHGGVAAAAVGVSKRQQHGDHHRAHRCRLCGLEFSRGQALGGHMRRHRGEAAAPAAAAYAAVAGVERPEMLDLNIPPADEADAEGDQAEVERAESVPRLLNLLV